MSSRFPFLVFAYVSRFIGRGGKTGRVREGKSRSGKWNNVSNEGRLFLSRELHGRRDLHSCCQFH